MRLDRWHRAALEQLIAGETVASVSYHHAHDVVGIYELRTSRNGDPYVTWLDLDGNLKWRRSYAATNYYLTRKRHILTDPNRCPCCGQEL